MIYGKLNKDKIIKEYEAITSPTANINIDNINNTLEVNMIKTPAPLTILYEGNLVSQFDGSQPITIDLDQDVQEDITRNISIHNTSNDSHLDIRQNINTLNNQVTTNTQTILQLQANSGNKINVTFDTNTYTLTTTLLNSNNISLSSSSVNLPLESMIINASYDADTKSLILTLHNGETLTISIADLVSGLIGDNEVISHQTLPTPTADTPDFVQDGTTLKYKQLNNGNYNYVEVGGSVGQTYPNSNNGEIFNNYRNNVASGAYSHAEGMSTTASGDCSHSEGWSGIASGLASHSEGRSTNAIGNYSHAEGVDTQASGDSSHAEGGFTKANGDYSHAEGLYAIANGYYSHAGGNHTIAGYMNQTAIGTFNDNKSTNLFEIGNGTSDSNRSNAFEVSSDGSAYANGQQLATQEYVNNLIGGVSAVLGDTEDLGV